MNSEIKYEMCSLISSPREGKVRQPPIRHTYILTRISGGRPRLRRAFMVAQIMGYLVGAAYVPKTFPCFPKGRPSNGVAGNMPETLVFISAVVICFRRLPVYECAWKFTSGRTRNVEA